ncbi:S1/P1 nuclease [Thalassotalea agarivorans]|uniref:S1/P1 Nuclease n=1 Tax=Thalassotalea agarivorans TaxID=349064 RepID=A0A1I0CDC9_THASX|nr:S1/P1 nuclease [Thalassotalea agarivorans]SET17021.1 hypothetical protein SAMN05660429_01142 [Thalassotalea agarivorans]
MNKLPTLHKLFTFLSITLLCLSTFLFSLDAYAFGKKGHKLVCQLAFEQLTKEKQVQITQLLATLPQKHVSRLNKYNYQPSKQSIDFATACTWADAIKKWDYYDKFKPWHYMNVPRNARSVSQCKNCVLSAITHHTDALATNTQSWDKLQALMFLGHWVGDIHQPFHVSFADDLGGNKIQISNQDIKCKNLHWYWDECMLNVKSSQDKDLYQSLKEQWQHYKLKPQSVSHWANESLHLARNPSLLYCTLDASSVCSKPKNSKVTLPAYYQAVHQEALELRLLLAAKRLHYILQKTSF